MSGAHSRKATPNQTAAMRRSAVVRQCPTCGRKSALVRFDASYPGGITTVCRWPDCGYARRSWTVAEWHVIRRGDAAGNALLASGINIVTKPGYSLPVGGDAA